MVTKTKKIKVIGVVGLQVESLRPAYEEIERMIEYGKQDMGFKNVRITPVIQTQGKRSIFGHFQPNAYITDDGQQAHEIMISAENLMRPAMGIYETVRHELVHALNYECGVSDCSRSGTYHNAKFNETAERFGLICADKTEKNGYGITKLTSIYEEQVLHELAPRDEAFKLARQVVESNKAKKKKANDKWTCGCTIIRATSEVDINCNKCGNDFEKTETPAKV